MVHVVQSIEVGRTAAVTYEQWTAFEGMQPFVDALRRIRTHGARLDWRAEVLTVAPLEDAALVTVRIDYDAVGAGDDIRSTLAAVARHLQAELARFKGFAEGQASGAAAPTWDGFPARHPRA